MLKPRPVDPLLMNASRRATLFTNGRNQAIRIPRDFELPGKEVLIRKEGDRLIIEPVPPPRLLAVLARLEAMDETFPDIDDRLPESVDL
jgi:antitoxin VapB